MDADLTIPEAAQILNPPLSEMQLTMIIAALNLPVAGARQTGRGGHPRRTYATADIMNLHHALLPWLNADP